MRRAALVVALALAIGGTAWAGGGTGDLLVSKQKDGPYADDFISISVNDRAKNTFWKAVNETQQEQTAELTAQSVDPGNDFNVKWFRRKQNITQDVLGPGYEFTLNPERSKRFRARVIPTVNDPGLMCVIGKITFPNKEEAVAHVAVNDPNACL